MTLTLPSWMMQPVYSRVRVSLSRGCGLMIVSIQVLAWLKPQMASSVGDEGYAVHVDAPSEYGDSRGKDIEMPLAEAGACGRSILFDIADVGEPHSAFEFLWAGCAVRSRWRWCVDRTYGVISQLLVEPHRGEAVVVEGVIHGTWVWLGLQTRKAGVGRPVAERFCGTGRVATGRPCTFTASRISPGVFAISRRRRRQYQRQTREQCRVSSLGTPGPGSALSTR